MEISVEQLKWLLIDMREKCAEEVYENINRSSEISRNHVSFAYDMKVYINNVSLPVDIEVLEKYKIK